MIDIVHYNEIIILCTYFEGEGGLVVLLPWLPLDFVYTLVPEIIIIIIYYACGIMMKTNY